MTQSLDTNAPSLRTSNAKTFREQSMSSIDLVDSPNVTANIAEALRRGYGNLKSTAKVIARAARSNPRAAENWVLGRNAPNAENLILLMADSDDVFMAVMKMAGRATEAERAELLRRLDTISQLAGRPDAPV